MHFGPDLPNWLLKVLTEMPGMPEVWIDNCTLTKASIVALSNYVLFP